MPHTKWNDNGIMYQHLQHILCPAWKENIKRFLKKGLEDFLAVLHSLNWRWVNSVERRKRVSFSESQHRDCSVGPTVSWRPNILSTETAFSHHWWHCTTKHAHSVQSDSFWHLFLPHQQFCLKIFYKVFSTCVDKIDLDLNFCGPKVENVSFNIVDDRLQQTNWSSSHQTHRQSFYVQCTLQSIFLLHSLSPYCLYIS